MVDLEKKTKQSKSSNPNSSNNSLLKSSKGKSSSKNAFDEQFGNSHNNLGYAYSDIESRQIMQSKNSSNLKK